MLKMYDYPRCPYCRKVRVALAEKGLRYDRVIVDITRGEQKREEFLKINPLGKVPAIIDDGQIIYESSIINEYLEDKYPSPPLMPSAAADRARVRILIDFCEGQFNQAWFNVYWQETFIEADRRDAALIQKSRRELSDYLIKLNRELEGRDYLAGDYSLADAAFTPKVAVFDAIGIGIPAELADLASWARRIKGRGSFSALEL
ncbi:MAG: glutathione S-transferase family protein [Deltaproteobacteria bacterium]